MPDYLCLHRRHRHARSFPRMVLVVGRLHLLSRQSFPKGGALHHTSTGSRHDHSVHMLKVCWCFGNYLALKLTYPEEPSSSRSWSLPSRCPVGSLDTSPIPWSASCNGSPSGLSLPYSRFPGFSVCSSSSPTR